MFGWGVLSTARIGRERLLPAMMESDNGAVAAVASREAQKARALAGAFNAPHAFGSYEELLACEAVEGVYIPLPTSQHVEWAIRAADAGKHVLVEKPLALKAADIALVIAARDRNEVIVSEAFMVAYHPQWAKVRSLLAQGAIGRLRHVQAVFAYHNVDPANMRNQPALGGGGLPDIGVYPTVAMRLATGSEPVAVRARVERDPAFGTDIYAAVTADCGDFDFSFHIGTQMAVRQHMVFHGEAGYIELNAPFTATHGEHPQVVLHDQKHVESRVFRFGGVNQYRLEVEAFVRAARGGPDRPFSLEESVLNQKVIDAIYRAGASDRWEKV